MEAGCRRVDVLEWVGALEACCGCRSVYERVGGIEVSGGLDVRYRRCLKRGMELWRCAAGVASKEVWSAGALAYCC